jgi:hypothetical protein
MNNDIHYFVIIQKRYSLGYTIFMYIIIFFLFNYFDENN